MSTQTPPAPASADKQPRVEQDEVKAEERPPQQEELLCTICGMRSCWRDG